jgi:Fe2+/Zn2+ uptake regulation proteins
MNGKEQEKGVSQSLSDAEELCIQHGVRLTELRRTILEMLLSASKPVKAYELIEKMGERGQRITPASIYRTLEFLLHYGLIHRINALNAYVPCTGTHTCHAHNLLMFVCSQCQAAQEIDDPDLYASIRSKLGSLGICMQDSCIEIQGVCPKCSGTALHISKCGHHKDGP